MISFIINAEKARLMMYRDAMNSKLLIKFMTRLMKDAGRKGFLILDNLCVHHSQEAGKWLEDHWKQIEIFHCPSNLLEFNPDEYLNGNLKQKVHSGKPVWSRGSLEKKIFSFMRTPIRRPEDVRSYFTHSKVAYAP